VSPIIFALPGNERISEQLIDNLAATPGKLETRHFPDGESYVRLMTDVAQRDVIFVCTLDHPDAKLLPLLFGGATAKELGAKRVGLIAPYLAYMRQDKRFHPGEAVTSRIFASALSSTFDWLVTVDPHLHRFAGMAELYSCPVEVCHAAPNVARWIASEVASPIIIGPDSESRQWVSAVAALVDAPYVTLSKRRMGDRQVQIDFPNLEIWKGRTPVLVDDLISSGQTMVVATKTLVKRGFPPPVIVAVHGIFADDAYADLRAAGAGRIVTTNSVPQAANAIDIGGLLASAAGKFIS
jgi:ribose-phosphate pyrophosphokinase